MADYLYWGALARALHCVIWWHVYPDGDYQPYLMPVNERTWAAIRGS